MAAPVRRKRPRLDEVKLERAPIRVVVEGEIDAVLTRLRGRGGLRKVFR